MTATLPTPSLAAALKADTQALHTAAERHTFHRLLFTGTLPLDRLAGQHAAAGRLQTALEHALDLASPSSPALRSLVQPYHRRGPLYAADLANLGVPAARLVPACPEEKAFLADLDEAARHEPLALVGVLYVLEGSTNGGPFIQKALSRAMPGVTLEALSPHGDQQAPRWGAFRAALDAMDLDEASRATVIAWAARTFELLGHMMSAAVAGLPPVTPASSPAH